MTERCRFHDLPLDADGRCPLGREGGYALARGGIVSADSTPTTDELREGFADLQAERRERRDDWTGQCTCGHPDFCHDFDPNESKGRKSMCREECPCTEYRGTDGGRIVGMTYEGPIRYRPVGEHIEAHRLTGKPEDQTFTIPDDFERTTAPGWGTAAEYTRRLEAGMIPPADEIDHPAHYGGADDPFEPIKIIEAKRLGFHEGNALKYILRAGYKPGESRAKDLRKAVWYLERLIELEGERDE